MTHEIFTAGRLTETQIKYALESGFKSIVALWRETHEDTSTFAGEVLPTTKQEELIIASVSQLTNMKHFALVVEDRTNWKTLTTLQTFATLKATLPKPILFHCNNSYQSSFVAILSLLDQSDIDMQDFYYKASGLGFDYFTDPTLQPLVQSVYGDTDIDGDKISHPDLTIPDWYERYWLLKPVHKEWYISGQIQINHLPILDTIGFATIINSRKGVTIRDSNPPRQSQEEAILLNIKDRVGTYTGLGRQNTVELLKYRIWPRISHTYISPNSTTNYAMTNYLQFGDEIGYNETLERIAIESRPGHPYRYAHTPVGKISLFYNCPLVRDIRLHYLLDLISV